MVKRLIAAAAVLGLAAGAGPCGAADDDGSLDAGAGGDAGSGPVTALFELPPTSEYYALPFPNDLRRRADGTIGLTGLPREKPLIAEWLDDFSAKSGGFGPNQAIFVRFSGDIDTTTLPPEPGLAANASVYLVNVDPKSPERGQRVPLRMRFQSNAAYMIGPEWLGCLPYPGFPLRQSTTYALVVTRRVKGADGTPVRRSADFAALMGAGGDAKVVLARTVYQPLLDWLDEAGGDGRDDVVDAAVYTTMDATSFIGKLRQVVVRPCGAAETFPSCIPEP